MSPLSEKICDRCNILKPIDAFRRCRNGHRLASCEECRSNIHTPCAHCGEPVVSKSGRRKYCSFECRAKAHGRLAEGTPRWTVGQTNTAKAGRRDPEPCAFCGELFVPRSSWHQCCSRQCRQKLNDVLYHEVRRAAVKKHYWANRDRMVAVADAYIQKTRQTRPWHVLIHSAKARAKKFGLPYDLTMEWAASRWTGKCEISGLDFILGLRKPAPRTFSPSIDRIDPKKGYVQDNCRFVLWAVNGLKNDDTDENMIIIATAIANQYARKR